MPATPVLGLPYPAPSDPADVPTDMGNLALAVETSLGSYGTSPPASPHDGQLWFFPADATNGIIWVFRYRAASASAYKWECVGGSPISGFQTAQVQNTNVNTFEHPATSPSLTLPRAGDYYCGWGGNAVLGVAGAVWVTGGLGSSAKEPAAWAQSTSATGLYISVYAEAAVTGATAGQALNWMMQSGSSAVTAYAVTRALLSARPIRVS